MSIEEYLRKSSLKCAFVIENSRCARTYGARFSMNSLPFSTIIFALAEKRIPDCTNSRTLKIGNKRYKTGSKITTSIKEVNSHLRGSEGALLAADVPSNTTYTTPNIAFSRLDLSTRNRSYSFRYFLFHKKISKAFKLFV